ncbi:hypothetical protein D3C76_27310 [compost metagenome]
MLKMRQRTRSMIYAGLVGAGAVGLLFAGYALYSTQQFNKTRTSIIRQYEIEKQQMKEDTMRAKISGWSTKTMIAAGHTVKEEDLQAIELPVESVPKDWIQSKEDISGKVTKISLAANTLLTETLLFEEEAAPDDLRYRDMGFIKLPGTLAVNDVVDVRIQFPTGQDYILLSKKRIQRMSLSSESVTMTIDEAEILSLSSAIVDAYLHKASIYALLYVEPYLQSKAIATYPANHAVLELIKQDPNIVSRAEQALQISSRSSLENDLSVLSPEKAANYAVQQAGEVYMSDQNQFQDSFVISK